MQQINLKEYQESCQIPLTGHRRDLLREVLPSISIEPIRYTSDKYRLKPSSRVGALEIEDMSVLIEPKVGIPKLLSLACYTMGVYKPHEQKLFDFQKAESLPDVLALALIAASRRAFGRGLLRGYLVEEDSLHMVRGRIRFDEQIRRRYGIPLPVELRFDEYTEDILANRLVKAAATRLGRMTLRSGKARKGLGRLAATLENVSLLEFRRSRVPEVRFDRLNEHYRHVVGLARLILLHSEFESFRGEVRASGFLFDMNKLFQDFVMLALRETLGVSSRSLRSEYTVHFDEEESVDLQPDLTWWDNGDTCTFVGDAKYKDLDNRGVRNDDLYQLLAYATALNLPGGLLIYAQGGAGTMTFMVRHAEKRLEVAALDLSGSFEEVLEDVGRIADNVKNLRKEALAGNSAARVNSSNAVPASPPQQ